VIRGRHFRAAVAALGAMGWIGCSSPAPPTPAPRPGQPASAPVAVAPTVDAKTDPEPETQTPKPKPGPGVPDDWPPRKRPDGTHLSMVEIRDSLIPGAGKGLFAKTDIPDETYIGFYDGRYLTDEEIDALDDLHSSYLFLVPECAEEPVYTGIVGDLNHPISKVNYAPAEINGKKTHLQNVEFHEQCEEPYEQLYTIRDVKAGEELYTDYGPEYDYDFMAYDTVRQHFLNVTGIPAQDEFTWEYTEQMAKAAAEEASDDDDG
jgi:hypothetical protein